MPSQIYDYQKYAKSAREHIEPIKAVIETLPQEFTAGEAIDAYCQSRGACNAWDVLNVLDHLVMASELVELTAGNGCWGQHRKYRR